eukprot:GGOE01065486.1.p1 GENE.GGOE01065486.1~~GGOE01065486.1.p1  ORF type:complete len:599 (-),score=191.04 GGOE01065486.1:157-1914(-)
MPKPRHARGVAKLKQQEEGFPGSLAKENSVEEEEEEEDWSPADEEEEAREKYLKGKGKPNKGQAKKEKKVGDHPGLELAKAPLRAAPNEILPSGLKRLDECRLLVERGFVPGMRTEGLVFATPELTTLLLHEMEHSGGQMQPALRQVANVAGLPGIVGRSLAMPDIHCGYGFAIGGVCAVAVDDPNAVVSPGGVGFDINCGVRLLRTNLTEDTVVTHRERLADALYKNIPVGAGSGRGVDLVNAQLKEVMKDGMQFLLDHKYDHVWPEDKEHCEEGGCLSWANPDKVSSRACSRGVSQVGTMGAGNHYCEVQVVDEIFDEEAAAVMGLTKVGQVCIMIHSGSRGLGHQVCTDYLVELDKAMKSSNLQLNDRQLACASLTSQVGKDYLAAMASAANFAFCNRTMMAAKVRKSFQEVFGRTPEELDMHQIYDVCHNVAKYEDHTIDGEVKRVLVHRKGATRSFPPGHPEVPEKYRGIGQPVIIGGSMGTHSYVLTGAAGSMEQTFGSTCHGAGREMSRSAALKIFSSKEVKAQMLKQGIYVRSQDTRLLAEEAGGAYKNVTQVVETCHRAGISKLCVRLRPIVVIKG